MSVLITVAELTGGPAATAAGALVIAALTRRSKRHQRGRAATAYTEAGESRTTLAAELATVREQVDTIVAALGPTDSAAFRTEAGKVLTAAQAAIDSYLEYGGRGDEVNPTTNQRRGTYVKMRRGFEDHKRKLERQLDSVRKLFRRCERLELSFATLYIPDPQDDTRLEVSVVAQAQQAIDDAAGMLASLRQTGWVVDSLEDELDKARNEHSYGSDSVRAREFITADKRLRNAVTISTTVASAARELPTQQREFIRQAQAAERRIPSLLRKIEAAEAALGTLGDLYVASAYNASTAALAEARVQHGQIADLVAELREMVQPSADRWNEAEETADELAAHIEAIEAACKQARKARSALADRMQRLRALATRLQGRIAKVRGNIEERDGKKQRPMRQALSQVEGQLNDVVGSLGQHPLDPSSIGIRLRAIETAIASIDSASARIDEEDETWIKVGVVGALAAIGIDLATDD
jgi:predicted nuclease with TOPRIM domain